MCIPCVVEISGLGSRTRLAFIFLALPELGAAFAIDEPDGGRCEVTVYAIDPGPTRFEDRPFCVTLLVRRCARTAPPIAAPNTSLGARRYSAMSSSPLRWRAA